MIAFYLSISKKEYLNLVYKKIVVLVIEFLTTKFTFVKNGAEECDYQRNAWLLICEISVGYKKNVQWMPKGPGDM